VESEEEGVREVSVPPAPSLAPAPEVWIADEEVRLTEPAPPVVIAPKEYGTSEQLATERMIVRTGNISLVIEDVPVAIDQITNMADGFEGYVVSSNVWKEGERLIGSITSGAWNGLVTFGHVLGNIVIWIGIFSPVWLVVGGVIYWLLRRRRRKQAQ